MALRAAPRQTSTSALLVQPLPLMTKAGAPPRTVRPRRRIVKNGARIPTLRGSPQGLHAFLEWTPYLYEGPYITGGQNFRVITSNEYCPARRIAVPSQCARVTRCGASLPSRITSITVATGAQLWPGGRPPSFKSFTCPNCQALYHIVEVEAGPETNDREPTCRACGGPLAGRDGKFVLKYFLLRKAAPDPTPRVSARKRFVGTSEKRAWQLTGLPCHEKEGRR